MQVQHGLEPKRMDGLIHGCVDPPEQTVDVLEPSTLVDLMYVPQPNAEYAIREELRILEERLESAAETLLIRRHQWGL